MSKQLRSPSLYVCLLWHPSQNIILRTQLQPSLEAAQMVAHKWGKFARYVQVSRNHHAVSFHTRKQVFALLYGKHMQVKVELFKEEQDARKHVPVVSQQSGVEFVCGFQF